MHLVTLRSPASKQAPFNQYQVWSRLMGVRAATVQWFDPLSCRYRHKSVTINFTKCTAAKEITLLLLGRSPLNLPVGIS